MSQWSASGESHKFVLVVSPDWFISVLLYHIIHIYIYKEVLNFLDRFAAAGASLAERQLRVLPMNQSTDSLQGLE
jgi:hypothetical protein